MTSGRSRLATFIDGLRRRLQRFRARHAIRRRALAEAPRIEPGQLLFVGGLHRSGTSVLHSLIREHPDVGGFEKTGMPQDEGQHLQSVYPSAFTAGGPGRFAFHFDDRQYEAHDETTATGLRQTLLREWGAYLEPGSSVIVEKSPPNIVRSRFLNSLFPGARFCFVVRHPLVVSMATQKWSETTLVELLVHWHVAHSRLLSDIRRLQRAVVVRYEDIVRNPRPHVDALCDFLGIQRFEPRTVLSDRNPEYFRMIDREIEAELQIFRECFPESLRLAKLLGYSLDGEFVIDTVDPVWPILDVGRNDGGE